MRAALLCFALVLSIRQDANAYMADGVGLSSCGAWTHFRQQPYDASAMIYESWVGGFLSGIGYIGHLGANPLAGVDPRGVFAWIDNYCRTNPINHIAEAAAAFYEAHPGPQ